MGVAKAAKGRPPQLDSIGYLEKPQYSMYSFMQDVDWEYGYPSLLEGLHLVPKQEERRPNVSYIHISSRVNF